MAKKKKGPKKVKVKVKTSKAHRQKGGHVKDYNRKAAKPHRNKAHKRNPRRTEKQIKEKGTRKEEKKKKSVDYQTKRLESLKRK